MLEREDNLRTVNPDDDRLLRACQQGDETALEELVRTYQTRLFQLAYRVLGDASLAEESTAHALFKVWTRCRQWRGHSAAGTWIYRVAIHSILDVRRSHERWWRRWSSSVVPDPADPAPGPAEMAGDCDESNRRARQVHDGLQQLPESDRVLLHLYYFESRSLSEIETILDVPQANLKMRLARGRDRLRRLLGGDGNER